MSVPAVELDKVRHLYAARIALDGISLAIESRCVFAFLGPNGGGKTTLFKILSTLLIPTSGTAAIFGEDVVRRRDHVRAQIGVVFQNPSLDIHLTVLENLVHQGQLYGLSGRSLTQRCTTLMQQFQIQDRSNDRVHKLSGGLRRRVELAKSLLHRPRLLILDEPSTGLDPNARASFTGMLLELRDKEGLTCVLTTHLIDEADRCDRVAIIDNGRLVAEGTPHQLKSTIGGDVITIRSRDPVVLAAQVVNKFGGKTEVLSGAVRIDRPDGHRFVPQLIEAFPGQIEGVSVGRPTLEDVFQQRTGRRLLNDAVEPA